jgi:hypothetical protein
MDELELRAVTVTPQPGIFRWQTSGMGNWNTASDWDWLSVPNSNAVATVFGDEAAAPTTVVTNNTVTAKTVQFDNAHGYVIAGAGSVTLGADAGNAALDVLRGSHQFQCVVNLQSDTEVTVAAGASLAFNNALNLGVHNLTKTGPGVLQINNALNTRGGTVIGVAGSISGFGPVSQDLLNLSASVEPGANEGVGVLEIGGNYTQESGGVLAVEIGGAAIERQYDQLAVAGLAVLDGLLDVSLVDLGAATFSPTLGDAFPILLANGGIAGVFAKTELPPLSTGLAWQVRYEAKSVILEVTSAAVPEPHTVALVLCAIVSLGCHRSNRSRQKLKGV